MDHDMFNFRKVLFYSSMDIFGNLMSFPQRFIAINLDFQVYINFVSKHPALEQVNINNIGM